uniref:Reverse transcriptase domain-containing protein n=1 Tax=Tanacetum cinerariifolium TaxID=118510 RepID=A0A699HSB7_TANCI|nr:hypothetical protein [Tanacetum cinerariifolium]
MASFDYRLNPLYPIKECSSCGALYTTNYCCSDGSLRDKIICDLNKTPDLSQRPPQHCPKYGNPVDGHYCQGCALLRKKFKEDLFTCCIENGILQDLLDASNPSNDNTSIVNALQEPFVVKQNPGENSTQRPPQINHHCCYGCGDSLEDIFCHQCTCELCGKGAHYGYNCPPKVLIIPDPEPFNNQTIDELPQTLPNFDPTCYSEDGNSFTYDSKSNLVDDSPNVFKPPPQPPSYSYEFCRNDAYYGHDCSLQFPVIHQPIRKKMCAELLAEEQEANINTQLFQYSVVPQPPQEEISVEILQEKRNQIDYVKTFLRKFNRISFYEMPKVLSLAWETILEIELAFENKHCQPEDILELFRRFHNDVQNIHEELAINLRISLILTYDSTSIDNDSFSIDNIEYLEASPLDYEIVSLEVMEIVIPKVRGIDDDILLTIKDDILHEKLLNINLLIANIKALKDNPTPSFNFMTKSSSTSLNFLLEETNTFDNSLPEYETFCFNLEEISSGSTTTRSDISLPNYEAFYDDHIKEISSGITTTHSDCSLYDLFIFDLSINPFPLADKSDFYEFTDELAHIISPPEYDCFCFKNEPNSGDFTMDEVEDTFPTREPRVHNALPTYPTLQLNLDFILSSESLFAYVVRIFLPFLSYSVAPQYLLSFRNEDTILIPASLVIISPLSCRMYLIRVELSLKSMFIQNT